MRKLWIFGHSLCLPYNLQNTDEGWDKKLAVSLNCELFNYAMPGVDNFFIYYKFLEYRSQIDLNDYVVFGWSHFSRKLFIVNEKNLNHKNCLNQSLVYTTQNAIFMRNKNPVQGNPLKWLKMEPKDSGIKFYDTWYNEYYSALEQQINFQSYLESVKHTCPGIYLPFYFSQESVKDITIDKNHAGFVTEFILDNKVSISRDDFHFNSKGHTMWALHLSEVLKQLENKCNIKNF